MKHDDSNALEAWAQSQAQSYLSEEAKVRLGAQALERIVSNSANTREKSRVLALFPALGPLLAQLQAARIEAAFYRQMFDAAKGMMSDAQRADLEQEKEKSLLERDRQTVDGTGKTTLRLLADEFTMSRQGVSERLRRLKRDGKIITSNAPDLTPEEVQLVRRALSGKVGKARGQPRQRK